MNSFHENEASVMCARCACLVLVVTFCLLVSCFYEKGSVESTHKVPTSHYSTSLYRTKHFTAVLLYEDRF